MPLNLDSHFTVHVNGSITENISPNTSFEVFEGIPCSGNVLTLNNILKAKRIYAHSKKLGIMEMVTGIRFEDVRVGDKIKVSYTMGDIKVTREGVVTNKKKTYAESGHVFIVDTGWTNLFIELLERPLPTKPGTIFKVTEIDGEPCDLIIFVRRTRGSETAVTYVASEPYYSQVNINPELITAWEPIN